MRYKFLEHTADLKFQAFGLTLDETFENSAEALIKSIFEGKVKSNKKIIINVKGKDLISLMYNFLEEFLFLIDAKEFLTSKVKVKISNDKKKLSAKISGDDIKNYNIGMHVKAITYNEMIVEKRNKKWFAQVVLDV